METRDVVIAGGGPVGLALACELRRYEVDVLVLERLTEPSDTIKAGAINGRSTQALERLGLGPAMEAAQREGAERIKAFLAARAADNNLAGGAGAPAGAGRPAGPGGSGGGAGGPRPATGGPAQARMGHFAGIFKVGFAPEDVAGALEVLSVRPHGLLAAGGPGALPEGAPVVGIPQAELERLLLERAEELGAEVRRGRVVADFDAGDDDVVLLVAGPDGDERVRARWLVGCDGGRSVVRKLAGFGFPGTEPTLTGHQAVVELDHPEKLPGGWNRTDHGMIVYGPFPGRVLTVEFDGPPADRDAPVTAAELEASIQRVSGTDVRVLSVRTATRWTDNTRLADTYRRGRVLLAGDAAHVHSPFGGQGLNLGLQDAANLGWKLAAVLAGRQPAGFLDTYTAERHPVAEQVLDNTRAQVALMRPDPQTDALRRMFVELMDLEQVNWYLIEKMSGLGIRYEVDLPAAAHPMVGRHLPDLAVLGADRRAVLVDGGEEPWLGKIAAGWAGQVRVEPGPTGLDGLTSMLIRPDGYLAWAAGPDHPADPDTLSAALVTWFGPESGEV